MRNKLRDKRKEKKYTQRQIAQLIGINQGSYCLIEKGYRNPSHEVLQKIFEILGEESISLIENTENELGNLKVSKNVLEYMNSIGYKKYTAKDIKAIRKSLVIELSERKQKVTNISNRSKDGKIQIYKRVANLCNKKFDTNFNGQDIQLFKKCARMEFENRTGKCTWSIPNMREKLGYNPITGQEEGRDYGQDRIS